MDETRRVKTSQAHGLGIRNVNKSDDAPPYIISPVFIKETGGKITPNHLLWPCYWGSLKENTVTPIPIQQIQQIAAGIKEAEESTKSTNRQIFSKDYIKQILSKLGQQESMDGKPVYINGGKLYALDETGNLTGAHHDAAEPYTWPFAHNVRPAAQSLGARGCEDCHSTKAPFIFGKVAVDSPFTIEQNPMRPMYVFQKVSPAYMTALAQGFTFRPGLKIIILIACGILTAVLLLYTLRALEYLINTLSNNRDQSKTAGQ